MYVNDKTEDCGMQELVDYLNGDGQMEFGLEGEIKGLTPGEVAVEAMRALAAQRATSRPPERVERCEDMRAPGQGVLTVEFDGDGDALVTVTADDRRNPDTERPTPYTYRVATVEFCNVGSGGGKSPATLAALRVLACAMAQDNRDCPGFDAAALRTLRARSAQAAIAPNASK